MINYLEHFLLLHETEVKYSKEYPNQSGLTEIGQLLKNTKVTLEISNEKKKSLGAKAKEIVSDNYKKFKEKPIDEHSTPVKGAIKLKNAAVKKLGWSK